MPVRLKSKLNKCRSLIASKQYYKAVKRLIKIAKYSNVGFEDLFEILFNEQNRRD